MQLTDRPKVKVSASYSRKTGEARRENEGGEDERGMNKGGETVKADVRGGGGASAAR